MARVKKPNEKIAKPKAYAGPNKKTAAKRSTKPKPRNVPATTPKTKAGGSGGKPPTTGGRSVAASNSQPPARRGGGSVATRRTSVGPVRRAAGRVEKAVGGTTIRNVQKALSGPAGSRLAPMGMGMAMGAASAALTAYQVVGAMKEKRAADKAESTAFEKRKVVRRGEVKRQQTADSNNIGSSSGARKNYEAARKERKGAWIAGGKKTPRSDARKAAAASAASSKPAGANKPAGSATKPMGGGTSSGFGAAFKKARADYLKGGPDTFSFGGKSFSTATKDDFKGTGTKNLKDHLNILRKRKSRKESTPSVVTKIRG
jgi:hypothetical protein